MKTILMMLMVLGALIAPAVGAGNTPVGNVMNSNVNANGHNITGAGTVSATSFSGSGVNNLPLSSERIYLPTTTSGGQTVIAPFSNVLCGDSIGAGSAGCSVPTLPFYGVAPVVNPNGWWYLFTSTGYCAGAGVNWNLSLGGQTVENALTQFYCSQGQSASLSLTNNSTSATLTATPGFIASGAIITSAASGMPTNTTVTDTIVGPVLATNPGNSTTITVSSAAGLSTGMWVSCLSTYGNGSTSGGYIAANTTITGISGTTITLNNATEDGSGSIWVMFYAPTVTLSHAWTGTTSTQATTVGGTLLTGTATFTSGSPTATITGTAPVGLTATAQWIGGLAIVPGSTATVSGTTMTMNNNAKLSGSYTFYASQPVYDYFQVPLDPATFYPQGVTSTAYLLSPNVTGVPGNFFNGYGVNDSSIPTAVGTFFTNYQALDSDASGCGYTVYPMTIVPSAANNWIGENATYIDNYNTDIRTLSNCIDVAAAFPPNHLNYPGNPFLSPTDGVHSSDMGCTAMAKTTYDYMMSTVSSGNVSIYSPLLHINSNYLATNVARTDVANTFTALQTFDGTLTIQGIASSSPSLYNAALVIDSYQNGVTQQWIDFQDGGVERYRLEGDAYNSGAFTITDKINGVTALAVAPNYGASSFSGGLNLGNNYYTGVALTINNSGVVYTIGRDGGTSNLYIQGNQSGLSGFETKSSSGTVVANIDNAGDVTIQGNMAVDAAGKGLQVKEGSNVKQGTATLVAGTATVSDSSVTANSRIFLTVQAPGGTVGTPYVSARSAGTSFTITSTSSSDTSTVGYEIFEPAP